MAQHADARQLPGVAAVDIHDPHLALAASVARKSDSGCIRGPVGVDVVRIGRSNRHGRTAGKRQDVYVVIASCVGEERDLAVIGRPDGLQVMALEAHKLDWRCVPVVQPDLGPAVSIGGEHRSRIVRRQRRGEIIPGGAH